MNHQQKIRTPIPKLKIIKYTILSLDDGLIEALLPKRFDKFHHAHNIK